MNDEGQVIAEAALIAQAVEGAEGLEAAVSLVGLEQEGCVVDLSAADAGEQRGADQHVVDAAPSALKTVGALCAVSAASLGADVVEPAVCQILQGGRVGIVVEVAGHDDLGISGQLTDGLHEAVGHQPAVGARLPFAAIAAGGMDDENV